MGDKLFCDENSNAMNLVFVAVERNIKSVMGPSEQESKMLKLLQVPWKDVEQRGL